MRNIKQYLFIITIIVLTAYSLYMHVKFDNKVKHYECIIADMANKTEVINSDRVKAELELAGAKDRIIKASALIEKFMAEKESGELIPSALKQASDKTVVSAVGDAGNPPQEIRVPENAGKNFPERPDIQTGPDKRRLSSREHAEYLMRKVDDMLKDTNFNEKVSDYAAEL